MKNRSSREVGLAGSEAGIVSQQLLFPIGQPELASGAPGPPSPPREPWQRPACSRATRCSSRRSWPGERKRGPQHGAQRPVAEDQAAPPQLVLQHGVGGRQRLRRQQSW